MPATFFLTADSARGFVAAVSGTPCDDLDLTLGRSGNSWQSRNLRLVQTFKTSCDPTKCMAACLNKPETPGPHIEFILSQGSGPIEIVFSDDGVPLKATWSMRMADQPQAALLRCEMAGQLWLGPRAISNCKMSLPGIMPFMPGTIRRKWRIRIQNICAVMPGPASR
jgi:hypothetical protein